MKTASNSVVQWATILLVALFVPEVWAQDRIEMETTTIKGNTELPKYLYVVPWQDKVENQREEQKLVLHNLYSDLFDPVMPQYVPPEELPAVNTDLGQ